MVGIRNTVISYPFRQPERVYFNPFKVNEVWISSFGNGLKVGSMTATGIDFVSDKITIEIAPNPVHATLTLQRATADNEPFEIIDLTGRLIKKGILKDKTNVIDTHDLPIGSYILKVNQTALKFIKE